MAFKTVASSAKTILDITDSYTTLLSNETITIACDKDGVAISGELGSTGKAKTTIIAYRGSAPLMAVASNPGLGQFSYSISTQTNCTAARVVGDQASFYINTISADSGSVTVLISLEDGVSVTKVLTFAKAKTGSTGKGISSTAITYLNGASGTVPPTGTWLVNPPSVPENEFLWTKTVITYTDASISTSYSVGKMGGKGRDAALATINPSSLMFKSTDGGATFSPESIILTPAFQGEVAYSNWQYSVDGGTNWITVATQNGLSINSTTKALTISKTSTLFTALITALVFRVNTNDATIYDTVTITKMYDVVDLTQQAVFNKLTNNGLTKGFTLDIANNSLYINASYIQSDNLVGDKFVFNNGYIKAAVIQDLSVTNAKIADATIESAKIVSLAADKIDAATLSAITADVGTLTAGLLKNATGTTYLDLTNGTFKLGSALDYNGTTLSIAADVDLSANTSITTKVSNAVSTKENTIIKQTTAPAHVAGLLWLDTSVTPNVLKRSTGSAWVKATPTTAEEVGAYSSTDGSNLAGRVTTAESTITQHSTDITSKVSQSVYDAKMGTFTGTVSEIKQTADAVTLAFDNQVVGGRNFLLKSGIPITTSSYLVKDYVLTEAIPAGTEVTLTIKGTLAATKTTFAAYNSGGSVNLTPNMTNMGSGIYQKTFTWTVGASSNTYVSIYQMASGQTGTSTIEWIKLEKGNVATDWNQAPEELISGITTIAANGVTVGQEGSTIVSNLHNEGLSIMDGETKVATFNGGLSEIPNVKVTTISGNVVNSTGAQTLNVGVGYTYSTITAALNALNGQYGNTKFIKDNGTVLVNVYGSISDNVMLYGWTGGTLEIRFQTGAKLIGRIYAFSCTTRIIINGISGADRGVIQHNGTNNQLIDSYASSNLIIRNLNFNKGSSAAAWAIRLNENSKAYITDCDFGQCQYGIMGYTGSIITAYNNRGSCTGNGMWISDSILTARGTIPNTAPYTSIGAYHAIGTLTASASTYSPPAQAPTDFTQTFDPIDIYTTVYGSSTRSTYYVDVAVQGRWNTMGSAQVGYFVFGSAVKTFMDEGTVKSVKLKIRRENSTHGLTTDVKPIPYNFTPTSSFVSTVCTRGEWSNQVSIDPATIGASSTTFSFYSSVVDSGYAKFDAAQLEVVVTKMV